MCHRGVATPFTVRLYGFRIGGRFANKGVSVVYICASTRCFKERTLTDACAVLTELEYDKFEVWLGGDESQTSAAAVAADADAFVVQLREMTRMSPIAFRLESDAVTGGQFEEISRAAKALRIAQITVPSSPVGTPFNSEIDRLKNFVEIGNRDGVRVSIKTEKGRLTEDPHTAVELCQSAKGLGLTLDPSYYLAHPLGDKAVDMMLPHALHVHLRDSTPTQLQVPLGLGELDYARIIAQLKRHNYTRALCMDVLPEYLEDEARPLELRKLRMLLSTLL